MLGRPIGVGPRGGSTSRPLGSFQSLVRESLQGNTPQTCVFSNASGRNGGTITVTARPVQNGMFAELSFDRARGGGKQLDNIMFVLKPDGAIRTVEVRPGGVHKPTQKSPPWAKNYEFNAVTVAPPNWRTGAPPNWRTGTLPLVFDMERAEFVRAAGAGAVLKAAGALLRGPEQYGALTTLISKLVAVAKKKTDGFFAVESG